MNLRLRGVAALSALMAFAALSGCGGGTYNSGGPQSLTLSYSGSLNAQLGAAYSGAFAVSGGTSPYRCAVSSGSLPSGLTLSAGACTLTGTPTGNQTGSFPITVIATDSAGSARTGSLGLTLVVSAAPLAITTMTLPTGAVNLQYTATIATSGGIAPVSCKLSSGATDGLAVNANCTITGTPTAAGAFSFGVSATDSSATPMTANATLSLTVLATPNIRAAVGNVPLVGASVQIYAAGSAGNGSAAAPLLAQPLTTDSNGSFTLPSSSNYTCPSSSAIVYLVASGGRVGAGGMPVNGQAVMASPGTCAALATVSSLVMNEATTAASAYSFAQFAATGTPVSIGATSTNLVGLTAASATANHLAPFASGQTASLGVATTAGNTTPVTSQAKLNLVANILNACLTGGSASTACGTLFTATAQNNTAPPDVLNAALVLAQHPGIVTAGLYAVVPSSPVFVPSMTSAPADWTLAVTYAGGGMSQPTVTSIDSTGRVWVANNSTGGVASLFTNLGDAVFPNGIVGNGLYDCEGGAVDANDNFIVSNLDGGVSSFGGVSGITKTGGTLAGFPTNGNNAIYYPIGVAIDTNGTIWVGNYAMTSVTLLGPGGAPIATYKNAQLVFPTGIALDNNHNGWLANQSSNTITRVSADGTSITSYPVGAAPTNMAVDASNNVWSTNYLDNGVGLVGASHQVVSPYGGFTAPNLTGPQSVTIDGNGNAWVTSYLRPSLTEFSAATSSSPGAVLSPKNGLGSDAQLLQAYWGAFDRSGNFWVSSKASNTITEFVGLAAPVKTPQLGAVQKP